MALTASALNTTTTTAPITTTIAPATTPLAAATTTAASAAMSQLAGQVDAHNVESMRAYLAKAIPTALGVDAACVAISINTGDDTIGIAAQNKAGANAATSGAKADCVAAPKAWCAARCAEILAQWPVTT